MLGEDTAATPTFPSDLLRRWFCAFLLLKKLLLLFSFTFCSFLAALNCWVAISSARLLLGMTPFWTCSAARP